MSRQTTITIEITSTLVVRAQSSGRYWCPQCAAQGEMVALPNADAMAPLHAQGVEQGPDPREVHRLESPNGSALICLKSLLACLTKQLKIKERS